MRRINWSNISANFFGEMSSKLMEVVTEDKDLSECTMYDFVGWMPRVAEEIFRVRDNCQDLVEELENKYKSLGFQIVKCKDDEDDTFEIESISTIDDKYIDSLSKFIIRASQPVTMPNPYGDTRENLRRELLDEIGTSISRYLHYTGLETILVNMTFIGEEDGDKKCFAGTIAEQDNYSLIPGSDHSPLLTPSIIDSHENNTWIHEGKVLKDVFELIKNLEYSLERDKYKRYDSQGNPI